MTMTKVKKQVYQTIETVILPATSTLCIRVKAVGLGGVCVILPFKHELSVKANHWMVARACTAITAWEIEDILSTKKGYAFVLKDRPHTQELATIDGATCEL